VTNKCTYKTAESETSFDGKYNRPSCSWFRVTLGFWTTVSKDTNDYILMYLVYNS